MTGATFHVEFIADYTASSSRATLGTHRCERCGCYFTGPCPIMRGVRGETVLVCQRCKEPLT